MTAVLFVAFFGVGIVMGCYHLFHGSYASDTDASEVKFSACEIQAYVPFIRHNSLAFPLICCDVRDFDFEYLAFELPSMALFREKYPDFPVPKEEDGGLYQIQSLYNRSELPGLTDDQLNELFSRIKHYPPPLDLEETPDAV